MNGNVARLEAALADRYRLERELGQGGMATVYLAHDLRHDRPVALKVLRPALAAVVGAERFLQEIRTTAGLQHVHILPLLDSGQADSFLWYVLPYVRGESLRARLEREHQLGIPEALAITKQIAGALDYAHRQGVIHRDVKPENILLQEGEAVLTDFGIALAVKEAAGPRLTETGLSLGTPQYMSPEQAAGERQVDARSDVYSLAAVLYEMLTGEPPHVGATAQVVIAKLMTERPTPVRVLRDTVPEGIDAAVARALAKVPADRFASAEAFVRALESGGAGVRLDRTRSRTRLLSLGAVVLILLAVGLWTLLRRHQRSDSGTYLDRTQVTFTGNARDPALSADGAQLAYVVTDCSAGPCRYGLEVKDLGGGGSRRLVDGATALHRVRWSPDGRFLLFHGVLGSRAGAYLVPLLGGGPRFLTSGLATFTPTGDSVVLTPGTARDTWIRIAPAEGEPADSFEVHGLRGHLWGAAALPGGRWFLVGDAPFGMRIIDRAGVQSDSLSVGEDLAPGGLGLFHLTSDALWFDGTSLVLHGPLVRVPLDVTRGRFGSRRDTVLDLAGLGFDVTPDGRMIGYGDGVYRFSVWALTLNEALAGRFDAGRRLLSATSFAGGLISPDGSRVLVARLQADLATFTIFSWAGGPGHDVRSVAGIPRAPTWTPDGLFAYALDGDAGVRFIAVDPETGSTVRTLTVHDSIPLGNPIVALADSGWAWISSSRLLRLQYPDDRRPRALPVPGGITAQDMQVAPNGSQIAVEGFDGRDSLLVYRIALPGGTATRLASIAPPNLNGGASWLGNQELLVFAVHGFGSCALYRLSQPGHPDSLGTIPRPCVFVQSAVDGRRVALTTVDVASDIWLARRSRRP